MANIVWKTKEEILQEQEKSKGYELENFYNSERQRGVYLITEHSLGVDYVNESDVVDIKNYLQYLNPKTSNGDKYCRPSIMDKYYPLNAE